MIEDFIPLSKRLTLTFTRVMCQIMSARVQIMIIDMTPPLPLLTIVLTLLTLGVLQGLITSVIIWFKKSPLLALWIGMFSLEVSQKILFVNNIAINFSIH